MPNLLVYRVQKENPLAMALTEEGVRRTGGRWNPVDMPLMYAATLPELAFLETLVHLDGTPLADLPPFVMLTLAIPAGLVEDIALADLLVDWNQHPYPDAVLQFLLPRLFAVSPTLAFIVPSVVLAGSPTRNVLLNPLHPRIGEVRLIEMASLAFDERLRPPAALSIVPGKKPRARKS